MIHGTLDLDSYNLCIWILGDESAVKETFSSVARIKVVAYLENGGKLFVLASEAAWDLEGLTRKRLKKLNF